MKKVGIVTITQENNYGNRLQNYAVQKMLEMQKVNVETIINGKRDNKIIDFIKTGIKYIAFSKKYKKEIKRRKKFREFDKHIKLYVLNQQILLYRNSISIKLFRNNMNIFSTKFTKYIF